MPDLKIEMTKQPDSSWVLFCDWDAINFGRTPLAATFGIVSLDFAAVLESAASVSGTVDREPIQNNLVYLGQQARNTLPIYNIEITRVTLGGVPNIQFVLKRSDGTVQEAWQPASASTITLIMTESINKDELVPDTVNSTVDFAIYPLEPGNPKKALINIYQNVDGTWQAIVTENGNEILNDDYASQDLAWAAAASAIA